MTFLKTLTAGCIALAAAGAADAGTVGMGYTLGTNGTKLVIIGDLADPATLEGKTIVSTSTGKTLRLSELTVRPKTGELYGYSDADDTVYLVDPLTGAATPKGTLTGATATPAVGFDFNPMIDRARIVSVGNANIVFNPETNGFTTATSLFYAAGDANAGEDPNVFANAYTNSVVGAVAPSVTLQYVIDSELDILATLANNTGVLATVGSFFLNGMAFDVGEVGGFDILSAFAGDNMAYALLTSTMGEQLFTFSLFPDAQNRINLTAIGSVGGEFGLLRGLAVAPSAVPLPAGGVLLLGALAGLGALARRRKVA